MMHFIGNQNFCHQKFFRRVPQASTGTYRERNVDKKKKEGKKNANAIWVGILLRDFRDWEM